jgi:hypothetical protein
LYGIGSTPGGLVSVAVISPISMLLSHLGFLIQRLFFFMWHMSGLSLF